MSRLFASIDVGNSRISAVAARWDKNRDYVLEGLVHASSGGFRKGMVTDASVAADSIAGVLKKLKAKTGRKFHDVYAGVSSTSVTVVPSTGVLLLSKYGREVLERDIKKCVSIGSTIKIPLDKEPLHRIVDGFFIDEEREIKNPLNLEGVKLGVRVNIITISSSALRNMSKCIAQAGYVPAGFIFSGLASAYRVLTEDDRKTSVALVDMSEDMTEVMVFVRGVLTGCRVLPVGACDIQSDAGEVDAAELDKFISKLISLPGWDKVSKIKVIGEGVLADNIIESLEKVFAFPVAAGTCLVKPFEELPPERGGYIASLGMLDYLQEERHKKRHTGNLLKRSFDKTIAFLDRYF